MASRMGNAQSVQLFLQHDSVNVNREDGFGLTAIGYAVSYDRVGIVLLYDPRIDFNIDMEVDIGVGGTLNEFSMACSRHGSLAIVEAFLERPEVKQRVLKLRNRDGSTPLYTAVFHLNTDVVQLLLTQDGIDVNLQDTVGQSALHLACEMGGSPELAQVLLHHPATLPNFRDSVGKTPLHIACRSGIYGAVKLLFLHNEST